MAAGIRPRTSALIGTAGILLSAFGGIWIGFHTYLTSSAFPRYPGDTRWFLLYLILLIASVALVWLFEGKALLIFTGLAIIATISTVIVRANLVKEFLILTWIILTAFSLGDRLLRWVIRQPLSSVFERLLLGLPLGLGGLMLLGLFLGVLGAYTHIWITVILGLLSLITLPAWLIWIYRAARKSLPDALAEQNSRYGKDIILALSISAIFLLGPFLWATAPSIRWDVLSYHVAVPAIYTQYYSMVELPESAQTYWAHYAEMLYSVAMLLSGQPLPGWIHLFTGGASAVFSAYLGSRLVNRQVGIITGVLFLTIPMVNYEIGTAYVEGFSTLFCLGMFFAGYRWWKDQSRQWILLAGIFAGFAVGVKLNALPLLAIFNILILILAFHQSRSWQRVVSIMIIFGIPVLVLWSPWLIRDAVWTGNPIFPNYNSVFMSNDWARSDLFAVRLSSFLSINEILRIPWDLVMNSSRYYHEAPGGALQSLPWLAMPWFYLRHGSFIVRTRKILAVLAVLVAIAFLLVFSVAHQARYLIPVFPLLSLLAAANIDAVYRLITVSKLRAVGITAGLILAVLYLLSSQASVIKRMPSLPERYPYRFSLGEETQEQFLERTLPFYPAFAYLDQFPGHPKVLGLGVEFRLYTNARVYGGLFSYEVRNIVSNTRSADQLAATLKEDGYDFILVYSPEYYYRPEYYRITGLTPEFLSHYTDLVFAENHTYLYQIHPENAMKTPDRINLLADPGFEESMNDSLAHWFVAGNPLPDNTPGQAYTGNVSIILENDEASGSSALAQKVDVEGSWFYSLGAWINTEKPQSLLQLLIQWNDTEGQVLKIDADTIQMTPGWNHYWIAAEAPPDATTAEISITPIGTGSIRVDDAYFSPGN